MSRSIFGKVMGIFMVVAMATSVWAECPQDKEPVEITTPSGITKTLCIPAAAVQGIETAAENSGGTIVASNCPCFSADDIAALDAIGEGLQCGTRTSIDIDGNVTFSSTSCSGTGGKVLVSYDPSTVNRCYFASLGDKYSGLPSVTIDEIINDNEYDTCVNNLNSVLSSGK